MDRTATKHLAALLSLLMALSIVLPKTAMAKTGLNEIASPLSEPTIVGSVSEPTATAHPAAPIEGGKSYRVLSMTKLPEGLAERRLSDEQIAALSNVSLEKLTNAISTFGDYVAWAGTLPGDRFCCDVMSDPSQQITIDAASNYGWLDSMISGIMMVGIAHHVLADDYPGMKIVILVTECAWGRTVTYGNAFPHGNGYDVLSIFPFVDHLGYYDVFRPIYLEDFNAVVDYAESDDITWGSGDAVTQVMTLDTDEGMIFEFDADMCTYSLSPYAYTAGTVTMVYLNTRETVEQAETTKPQIDLSTLGEYRLLPKDKLPGIYAERRLSDAQIADLLDAGVITLRETIGTFADYVAWVAAQRTQYYCAITSGDNHCLNLDPLFNFQWADQMIGGKMLASMAMYVLGDDYPSIQTALIVTGAREEMWIAAANVLPAEDGGFYVLAAESYVESISGIKDVIEPLWVSEPSGLVTYGLGEDIQYGNEGSLVQVIVFDHLDNVEISAPNGYYPLKSASQATELYLDRSAKDARKKSALKLSSFGFPETLDLSTEINENAARQIKGGSLEEAAARLNSIADVISYFYYAFEPNMQGDLCYNVPGTNLGWHFNYTPQLTFERDVSSCGAVSGLVECLLSGDYDEVGIIGMTYKEGGGGGHVINYFKAGEYYCTVDFNGYSTSGFMNWMLGVHFAKTLDEAVMAYTGTDGYVKLAYTYQSLQGDAPVGWDDSHLTRLIEGYGYNFHIVFETPKEGYRCKFVTMDQKTQEIISAMRNR